MRPPKRFERRPADGDQPATSARKMGKSRYFTTPQAEDPLAGDAVVEAVFGDPATTNQVPGPAPSQPQPRRFDVVNKWELRTGPLLSTAAPAAGDGERSEAAPGDRLEGHAGEIVDLRDGVVVDLRDDVEEPLTYYQRRTAHLPKAPRRPDGDG